MIKVSIIVPIYNAEAYLSQCLNSLIAQDYGDFEIICIDDCSTDSSAAIARQYSALDSRVSFFENTVNSGQGKSRMKGIAVANGDYIAFVDSDDYVAPNYISSYVAASNNGALDLIIGGYTRDIDGNLTEKHVPDCVWSVVTYSVACCKMIKRSFILEHGISFPTARKGEDIFFNLSLYYSDAMYKVIDYCGYFYRLNRNSTTQTLARDSNFDNVIVDMFDEFIEQHDLSCLPQEKYSVIEYAYLANVFNALLTYCAGCNYPVLRQKYLVLKKQMLRQFPNYRSNQYLGWNKAKGQSFKIRMALFVMIKLEWIRADRIVLLLLTIAAK